MEKIQQDINFLSLLFACFFVFELAALVFGFSTYAGENIDLIELMKTISFFSMIPIAIVLVQLAAKLRDVKYLWAGIGVFILHIVTFIGYGLIS